jgi:hypothetical protein
VSEPAFDSYLAVDWSAAGTRNTGANSIWWALRRADGAVSVGNPATRAEAVETVARLIAAERAAGRRVLAGFDFPFGYPAGVAERVAGAPGWRALWARLAEAVEEAPRTPTRASRRRRR